MARLVGWECDKCNAQIKKDEFPDAWGKIYIEYFDGKTKEELVWCNSCISNLKHQVPYSHPVQPQQQSQVQSPASYTGNKAMYSRAPLNAEQLLASAVSPETPVENS